MDLKLKNNGKKLTKKVLNYKLEKKISYDVLAKELGMSKMTLFKRKKLHTWSITEAFFIQTKF